MNSKRLDSNCIFFQNVIFSKKISARKKCSVDVALQHCMKIDPMNRKSLKCNYCTNIISNEKSFGWDTYTCCYLPLHPNNVKSMSLEKLQERNKDNDLF